MKYFITNLVRKIFSIDNLIEEIESKIANAIDYEELADAILDQVDLESIIDEVAEDEIECC